jgi:type II secretory pathway pseudopilin PulG
VSGTSPAPDETGLYRVSQRNARGFALLDLIFVCGIIGVLASIALPRMLLAKQAAGAASAIGSLRTINSAELTYALTCGNGFYAPNLTTLGAAPPGSRDAFISPELGSANSVTKSGYQVQLSGTAYALAPPTCNGLGVGEAAQSFKAGADPIEPGNFRFFATNVSQTIYEDSASMFAAMPEVGMPPSGQPLH